MRTIKLLSMLLGLTLLAGVMTFSVMASPLMQGVNLLQDPNFDLAAQGVWKWERWSYQIEVMKPDAKKDPDPNQSFYTPNFMRSEPRWDHGSAGQSGAAGAVVSRAYTKFRGGFYQTVDVGKGARVRFSVWANELCDYDGSKCSVLLQAGIDPNGGTDWSAANIKWAGAEVSNNKYVQLVTEEVTVGASGKVTVFTWGEPRHPAAYSAAFFDDAELIGATSSTAPVAATPQPAACAQLRWVSDVTIPDNTVMAAGAQFIKTWRVRNAGTCAFSGTLNFVGAGVQMGGASPVTLPKVDAGQQADISINLTAPTKAGDYYGTWQPRTSDGTPMENLVVRIKVSAEAPTAVPAVTATPQRLVAPTQTIPPTPSTSQICVLAYNDANGDGQQGADENRLAGVVFALSDASGPKESYTTDSTSELYCFANLALGNYQLTIKPPANYAATTPGAMTIGLGAGIKPNVVYGAKLGGSAPAPTRTSVPPGAATGGSAFGTVRTVLIVVGVIVLIGLVAAGGFVLLSRRPHL